MVQSEIIACWVGLHFDPEQQSSGKPYSVRVDVAIPGHELIAQRVQHEDLQLALGHAFEDLEQQLKAIDPRINHAEYAATIDGHLATPVVSDKPTR